MKMTPLLSFVSLLQLISTLLLTTTTCVAQDGCTEGDIRLRDGANSTMGRVEVCNNSAWGTVCDDGWSSADALVACRQLGFPGYRDVLTGDDVVDGTGQIVLGNLHCNGTESKLVDCRKDRHYCGHTEDAGVSCRTEVCDYDLNLVRGNSKYDGAIDVCTADTVGYVCDSNWTIADATVACRQLGYSSFGAEPKLYSYYSRDDDFPGLLVNVMCNGNESRLVDCERAGGVSHSCRALGYQQIGVSCLPPDIEVCTDGVFRLAGGRSNNEGRVEYCNGSIWRSVRIIGGNVDDTDATIICRQLGLSDLGIRERSRANSQYSRYIVFEDVNSCIGTESNFTDCYRPVRIGELLNTDSRSPSGDFTVKCITGLLLVKKLSGGEVFAILFCYLLFVGGIIALVLSVVYYKQWTHKKLARTRSLSSSSSDISPPTAGGETAARSGREEEERLAMTSHDETGCPSLDRTVGEAPPAYCETAEQSDTA